MEIKFSEKEYKQICTDYLELLKADILPMVQRDINGFYFTVEPYGDDVHFTPYVSGETYDDYLIAFKESVKVGKATLEAIRDTDDYHPQIKKENDYANLPF